MFRETLAQSAPRLQMQDALLAIFAFALASFLTFHKYELLALFPTVFLLGIIPVLTGSILVPHFSNVFAAFAVSFCLHYSIILAMTIAYRLSPFHPLASYPGPVLPKISRFFVLWKAKGGKQHLWYKELHRQYGPFVRIGPNELSMADLSAIFPVLGPRGMIKGPMYEGRRRKDAEPSLITVRDAAQHAVRRKVWARAFTASSVKEYEPSVEKRIQILLSQLEKCSSPRGEPHIEAVVLAKFDFMGDMAFGGGFELMTEGDREGLWDLLQNGVVKATLLEHIPWVTAPLQRFPSLIKSFFKFRDFPAGRVILRKQKNVVRRDLFYHLIDEAGVEVTTPPMKQLMSDAALAIVAGSDTTSTVLSFVFFHLLSHPAAYGTLQLEIDSVYPPSSMMGELDSRKLASMAYLNAVINEAMRLDPPVSTRIQREPEKGTGGQWVGDRFVPEGTAIQIPPYVLHRDPRYFSPDPDSFRPERWLSAYLGQADASKLALTPEKLESHSEDGFSTNVDAFIPFSFGRENCVGKGLALLEMRMVVVRMMQHFDITFADEYSFKQWDEDREDLYLTRVGALCVVLKKRH